MPAPQPLVPPRSLGLLPPLRLPFAAFIDFSRSFSEALAELEGRYAAERKTSLAQRQAWKPLPRRPR